MNDILLNFPSGLLVALGKVPGVSQNRKFGKNSDVDAADLPEDIWDGGGLYTGHNATSAEIVQLFSSSANDTSAGTGARTVQVTGLDANYEPISEVVTLNGTTAVDTVNSYLRLDAGIVLTAGSGAKNAGTITARQKVTTANVFFVMRIGDNQSQVGCFTVPAGYTAFIVDVIFSVNRTAGGAFDREADVNIFARPFGSVYASKFHCAVTTGYFFDHEFQAPIEVTEKSDVVLRIESVSIDNTDISGQVEYFLFNNDLLD